MTRREADGSDLPTSPRPVPVGTKRQSDFRKRGIPGVILLEAALAVIVFAVAGTVIFSVLRDGVESQQLARRRERLTDLARSALALIEAGAATPETLAGPVRSWPSLLSEPAGAERSATPDGAKGGASYELSIQTQPWGAGDLTLVTVEARRLEAGGAAADTFMLRQLVRLSRRSADESGRSSARVELEPGTRP